MNTGARCFECFISQTLRTGRLLGLSEESLISMVKDAGKALSEFNVAHPPPRNARIVYDIINRHAGSEDPFRKAKDEATRKALSIYPELSVRVRESVNPLATAIKFAIAGNIIDFGIASEYDLEAELEKAVSGNPPPGVWHEEEMEHALKDADWILYLADNAGESVMDRIFIETVDRPVKYAVRSGPIINDVEKRDAVDAGIDQVAEIIETGCAIPGIALEESLECFKKLFMEAPLVISKGQGNYETLSDSGRPIFFLLKAKCPVVANMAGVKVGDLILQYSDSSG